MEEVCPYPADHRSMEDTEALGRFYQTLSAAQCGNQKGIVHLKAKNLLSDADLNIKVADFGLPLAVAGYLCGSPS